MLSLAARITRAIQLGVLVGFVVVAPAFRPSDDSGHGHETMRDMCKKDAQEILVIPLSQYSWGKEKVAKS